MWVALYAGNRVLLISCRIMFQWVLHCMIYSNCMYIVTRSSLYGAVVKGLNIFRQICKSTSAWRRFAKTLLLILQHLSSSRCRAELIVLLVCCCLSHAFSFDYMLLGHMFFSKLSYYINFSIACTNCYILYFPVSEMMKIIPQLVVVSFIDFYARIME